MSKQVVVAMFDSAIQSYGQPIFVPAVGAAVRSFADEVNRKADGNMLNAHPDDFELHQLAEFDTEEGSFVQIDRKVLARGKDVIIRE